MDITTIIFDLGGVIIDVDEQRTLDAFRDLGFYNIEETYAQLLDEGVLDQVETGRLSPDDFFNLLNTFSLELISPDRLADAWSAMLMGIPEEHIELLQKLAGEYRLLALSNTNAVHIEWIRRHLAEEYGLTFDDLFQKVYFSFEMGLRKPDPAILKAVLRDQELDPGECLFLDDLPENIESASRLGLVTELIDEENPLLGLFN